MSLENRVKVCWKCKTYIRLFHDNPISQIIERKFDTNHFGHTVQVVNKNELDNTYKLEKKENE